MISLSEMMIFKGKIIEVLPRAKLHSRILEPKVLNKRKLKNKLNNDP